MNTIIETMAKERMIEVIIENVAKTRIEDDPNLADLAQDLYLDLLQKPTEKIQQLSETGQIRWFVTRMVVNNLKSKNSRYYYTYIKDKNNKVDIDDYEG